MDRIDLFRIFTRVVDSSSFTRAADTLGLPRSSVSTAVAELEARLGTRLLNRTTRSVATTPDGAVFYERCQQLIADVEEAESLFRTGPGQLAGRIRIDLPGRIGRLVVVPALPGFLDLHPGIDIDLGLNDRTVNMIGEGVDAVLRVGRLAESGLIARSLGMIRLINVASPAYLARAGTPQGPGDLGGHLAVGYASPTTGKIEPWEWVENGAPQTIEMRARVTVNNAEGYIAACLAGLGMIQIPAYDVTDHLAAGRLVEVMPDHRAEAMPITLLYPHRQHLSGRLKAFADWLADLLRREVL